MVKGRKLKVYRIPIGFHDAYVAAPSQKAAIEAWGADGNPFARGEAEEVTDARLTKAPLERPGEVIKVLRGTAAEQMKALGKIPERGRKAGDGDQELSRKRAGSRIRCGMTKRRKRPKPSRAALDKAEKALAAAEARQEAAIAALRREEEALAKRRRELEARQAKALARLQEQARDERAAYTRAMGEWASD